MMTEMSLGRKTRHDPVQAYADIDPHAKIVGIFGVMAAFVILSYYSVIGGWIIKYIISYGTTLAAPADFTMFISSNEPVIWHFVFMANYNRHMFLWHQRDREGQQIYDASAFVLLIVIIVRSVTLPGASEGLRFIFHRRVPDSAWVLSVRLWDRYFIRSACAWGLQLPTALSQRKENIPKSCLSVAGLDTAIAILAGIAIFPAVFSFQLEPKQGPGLIFGTPPMVFSEIKGGPIFAFLFFALVFLCGGNKRDSASGGSGFICN